MGEEIIYAACEKLEADNRIPLKDYYDLAGDLLVQADMYRKENNLVDLYLVLLRFASLVMETISSHQDYKLKHRKQRHYFNEKVIKITNELESLKADVNFLVAHMKSNVDRSNKNTGDLTTHVLKIPNSKQIQPMFDEEQLASHSEFKPSEKGNDKHDEVIPCHTSKSGIVVLNEQGSCALPVDDQSLKQENIGVNDDIYAQLQHAIADIGILKQEAYKESCERLKAEREVVKASHSAIASERLHAKEKKQRIKTEKSLLDIVLELETLENERDELLKELHDIQNQKESLETEVAILQEKLTASEHLIGSLHMDGDNVLKTTEGSRAGVWTAVMSKARNVLEFSNLEIEQATQGFDNSMKIGECSHGSVYRGFLRHTLLAIKADLQCMLTQKEFFEVVDTLSRLRHPNLVNFIGICPEFRSPVFEFLPNGSLENYLDSPGNSKPLNWKARISATAEICSTLIFLHSCRPDGHGNLKPSNILFDAHFKSKLGDFHINQGRSTATRDTEYMDPEFLSTGNLTTKSDIYSFGVIILRLLTGRPAFGIIDEVTDAMDKENLQDILDKSAGQWPFLQAKQLLHLALRCCQSNSCDRPDLADEVWRILEPMKRASSGPGLLFFSSRLQMDGVPSHFLCPILQEIMTDPHVAADGFTYEAEAIRAWLESGHNTSPMTNTKLSDQTLIPNHALRSFIQEWLRQQGEQHRLVACP